MVNFYYTLSFPFRGHSKRTSPKPITLYSLRDDSKSKPQF